MDVKIASDIGCIQQRPLVSTTPSGGFQSPDPSRLWQGDIGVRFFTEAPGHSLATILGRC